MKIMEKSVFDNSFSVEDIRKLREYNYERTKDFANHEITLKYIALTNTRAGKIETGEELCGFIEFTSEIEYLNLSMNLLIRTGDGNTITKSESANTIKCVPQKNNRINSYNDNHFILDRLRVYGSETYGISGLYL